MPSLNRLILLVLSPVRPTPTGQTDQLLVNRRSGSGHARYATAFTRASCPRASVAPMELDELFAPEDSIPDWVPLAADDFDDALEM